MTLFLVLRKCSRLYLILHSHFYIIFLKEKPALQGRDREAWNAAVHGLAESGTRLSD